MILSALACLCLAMAAANAKKSGVKWSEAAEAIATVSKLNILYKVSHMGSALALKWGAGLAPFGVGLALALL